MGSKLNMRNPNEKITRQEIIDKRLAKARWDVKDISQVTTELNIWIGLPLEVRVPGCEYHGFQFADYGWIFINHMAILICYKIFNLIKKHKLLTTMNPKDQQFRMNAKMLAYSVHAELLQVYFIYSVVQSIFAKIRRLCD